MPFWNFPAVAGGNINSINNAGLETFRDNALDSLTREICQNSLDAVKNPNKPVVVEFKKFTTEDFPKKADLIDAFNKCKSTWQGKNKKSEEFINHALEILYKTKIDFLRISDFNTVGLKGAKEAELGSPWSSLVKEAGSSNKDDSSGGSFGIGKAAPFLNSNLRTLFYSSYDDDGYKSYIGVANIMSFKRNNNEITLGNGYFTNDKESHAIEGVLNIDESFNRNEFGTDIFVSAFNPITEWELEVINSVLKNFFITIFKKKLIVKINNFEINNENLADLISRLDESDENRILKNYFHLLTSSQTIKIKYPAKKYKDGIKFEEGEAELYLMNGENLNRRVLMTRKNGMRIFEQGNISGSISFTGLLIITGSNMNSIFKQMENPAHNGWSHNRYEKNPNLAKKIYTDLRKFIRDQVKELFQQSVSDIMDAVGLSDFLPNKNLIAKNGGNKAETINNMVKSISYKEKEQQPKREFRSEGEIPTKTEEQLLGEYGITPGEQGGNGLNEGGSGGNSGGGVKEPGGPNEIDTNEQGNLNVEDRTNPKNKPISCKYKYACSDKMAGKYKFLISTERPISKGKLTFKVIGEQSDYDLPIKNATFQNEDISIEKVSSNAIFFVSSRKYLNLNLNIQVDYSDYCVMEVGVYED